MMAHALRHLVVLFVGAVEDGALAAFLTFRRVSFCESPPAEGLSGQ